MALNLNLSVSNNRLGNVNTNCLIHCYDNVTINQLWAVYSRCLCITTDDWLWNEACCLIYLTNIRYRVFDIEKRIVRLLEQQAKLTVTCVFQKLPFCIRLDKSIKNVFEWLILYFTLHTNLHLSSFLHYRSHIIPT